MKAAERKRATDDAARDHARRTIETEVARCAVPAALRVALGLAERAAMDAAGDDAFAFPRPGGPTIGQARRAREAYARGMRAALAAIEESMPEGV